MIEVIFVFSVITSVIVFGSIKVLSVISTLSNLKSEYKAVITMLGLGALPVVVLILLLTLNGTSSFIAFIFIKLSENSNFTFLL